MKVLNYILDKNQNLTLSRTQGKAIQTVDLASRALFGQEWTFKVHHDRPMQRKLQGQGKACSYRQTRDE